MSAEEVQQSPAWGDVPAAELTDEDLVLSIKHTANSIHYSHSTGNPNGALLHTGALITLALEAGARLKAKG